MLTITQTNFKWINGIGLGFFLVEINDRSAESVEQDHTARMCSVILLYTFRNNYQCSQTGGQELRQVYTNFWLQ